MAVTDQQKLDFLLKKIGYTKTKTGSVVGTGAISGTPKQPFAEAIPSPLVVPNSSLWNEAASIPTTPPGSDTPQVKVYLAASSGLRMTADSTSSGQRAYIAYSTYGNTSSARLTNWIDTQFGASYLIKVYKGDPNSGGVALSAAGSGSNDGWFFDYSAGVLNFNDTSVPSGVTDTNIYIVGYRYIGQTGAPTSGISTFSNLDLTVERNLDVGKQGGISTFRHNIDADGIIEGIAGENKIPSLYANLGALPSPVTYHGMFAHVHSTAKGYFSHAGGWYELVNKETNGVVGTGTETYNLGTLSVTGNVSIGGTLTYEDVKNVDAVGLITARSGIRVTGGVIEAQAGENKIPSLYAAMGNLPSAGSYHGMFAHVHATGRGYFAHAGNWLELVNREINGVVGTGTETYNIGNLVSTSSTATSLNVSGVTTAVTLDVNGDLDVDGHTNLDNVNIVGVATITGDIEIPDNSGTTNRLKFGDDEDFQLYFGGNNATIFKKDTGGSLQIRSEKVEIKNFANNKTMAVFNASTDVRLTYNGNLKLNTNNTGINVTGNTVADGLVIDGDSDLNGDLDVDGHTNLDNVSIAGVTTMSGNLTISNTQPRIFLTDTNNDDDFSIRNDNGIFKIYDETNNGGRLKIYSDGHVEVPGNLDVGAGIDVTGNATVSGDLDVDGHTNLDNVSIAGVTTFSSKIGVHDGTTGSNGQYLRATGTGVTWANFPTMRTSQTFTASSGQTTFSFTYNVGYLDVFVNGVKLTSSEFTAANGTSVVLSVGSFVGDIVELVSYFTTSYAAGSSGLGEIVEDTTPQLGGNLDMFNKSITGTGNINLTGIISATNFVGDGSGLTGITASGSGVIVKDSGSTVGTAGTINFGDNLSVSPASAGIVTITASAGASSTAEVRANTLVVTGVSTLTNIDVDDFIDVGSNIQLGSIGIITALTFKGNGDFVELDVDGHTNLDNVNVAGVSTFAGTVNTAAISASGALSVSDIRSNSLNLKNAAGSATYAVFTNGGSALLKHNNTDRLETSASGVTVTGTVAATSYTGDGSQLTGVGVQTSQFNVNKLDVSGISTFKGAVDINADIDVDGHTNLDNVSIAGVTTASDNISIVKSTGPILELTTNTNGADSSLRLHEGTAGSTTNGGGMYYSGANNKLYITCGTTLTTERITIDRDTGSVAIANDLDVDGHTNLDNVNIVGVTTAAGNILPQDDGTSDLGTTSVRWRSVYADTFVGDGSGLTGITASGSGIVIKNNNNTVGTAGTINFGETIDVSAVSGGSVTVGVDTSQFNVDKLNVSGIATFSDDVKFDGSSASIYANWDQSGNALFFRDSSYIKFGNNNGMELTHSGGAAGNGNINNRQGGLVIRTTGSDAGDIFIDSKDDIQIRTHDTSNSILCTGGAGVKLYFGGNQKFETTNTGAVVTGILTATSFVGDGSNLTGISGGTDVGITTNLSGTFTASAGSPSTINTFGYGSGDLVVEYTIYIKNGSDFQTQKLLAMRDGTTIHSTQFAVMFSSSLLVQCDATISSGNILLRATPETGVSGSTTYKIKREVM